MAVLEYETGERIAVTQAWQINELLDQLDQTANTHFILTRSDGHFLQAAYNKNGFVVEQQQGGLDKHFRASRTDEAGGFSLEQVKSLARDFFDRSNFEIKVNWEPVDLAPPLVDRTKREYWVGIYGDNRTATIFWINERIFALEWQLAKVISVGFACWIIYIVVRGLLLQA